MVPDFLKRTDFPAAQTTKKGVTSTTYDMSKRVLDESGKARIDYLVAIGGDDTLSYAAVLDKLGFNSDLHSEDDGQRRSQHGILHRLLDRYLPRQATLFSGSAQRWARMNASEFSVSSAAMPATPRSIRRT